MSKLCTVVFTGQLIPGTDPEQAAQKFAAVFKVPEDKARQLIRDGKEKALKKDVDPTAAAHYRDVLTEIGFATRIDSPDGAPSATPGMAQGKTCPKCGSPRVDNGVCRDCGILVEAFVANQSAARKAQSSPLSSPPTSLAKPAETAAASASAAGFSAANPSPNPSPNPSQAPLEPRTRPAGQGLSWIAGGWTLFKQAPTVWIGALLVLLLINIALAFVPVIGSIASVLISPVLMGGFMLGANKLNSGQPFVIKDFFAGFSTHTGSLVGIGAFYMLGSIVLTVLAILIMLGPMMSAAGGLNVQALEHNPEQLFEALGPNILLMFLVMLALIVPLFMAYWFAPALVMLNGMSAIAAMKLSFIGCLRNILPFLVYGLVSTLLMIAAIIPFGLGLLVLSPVLIASIYVAYRDIYGDT